MVNHNQYLMQQKALIDKKQTFFSTKNTEIQENNRIYTFEEPELLFSDKVICPFCLNLVELGVGFKLENQFYKCLKCNNLLTKITLAKIIYLAPEEFAKWVFNYRLNGFWQKIKFKEWCKELEQFDYNYSKRFWEKYHDLRGDINDNE
jgi:hypothetical protein